MWGHNNPVLHKICSREWREVRQLFGNWNVNLIAQTKVYHGQPWGSYPTDTCMCEKI